MAKALVKHSARLARSAMMKDLKILRGEVGGEIQRALSTAHGVLPVEDEGNVVGILNPYARIKRTGIKVGRCRCNVCGYVFVYV